MSTIATDQPTRRDFLYIATGAVGAVGVGFAAWPFVHQMNPDASALALASIEVDVGDIEEGQSIIVKWRGKPIFIRNRTAKEIEDAKAGDAAELIDGLARNPNVAADAAATDANRTAEGKENLIVMIGICTHLGCPPAWLEAQNKFKCPCHGSGYYKSGINFEGPTPRPLERARIFVDPSDGQIVVDKAQKYQWELGQWTDPSSFITLA